MLETLLISTIPASVSLVLGYIFARNRNKAETKGIEKNNDDISYNIYRKLLDDVDKRVEKLTSIISEYREKMVESDLKIKFLEEEVGRLKGWVCYNTQCLKRKKNESDINCNK